MSQMIEIKNFSKSFGEKKVISDLSFEVEEGEIFAFLGPNGSGKTTTIRCLLNIYQADEGDLLIDGEPYSPELSSLLGYLPEERGLYITSKVLETMVYFGELKGMSKSEATEAAKQYLEKVELTSLANTEIKRLSSGQQQKIQLGITIINRPLLLILDEPTKGLDPLNRELLLDILLDLHNAGSTIVFSTHQMEEAEKIANRIIMIKDGQRRLYGKVQDVKERFGRKIINLIFDGVLPENNDLYTAKVINNTAELIPKDGVSQQEILKFLVEKGVSIYKFEMAFPTLNEIFLNVMREEPAGMEHSGEEENQV